MATNKKNSDPAALPAAAPPSATGAAGSQFEARVGAFYLLALLGGTEPRGLPGATVQTVAFQQYASGRPLDDVIVEARNPDGSAAVLEIQAKRGLTFTASDSEFADVVRRMWAAVQKPEFKTETYELAVAIARTTTRIEMACQEVLHWARQLPNGSAFIAHIEREGFASSDMRSFVQVFRTNLGAIGAPTDDEAVWRLLRHFQILVFDFESPGSDYDHRAREKARSVLTPQDAGRASDLWSVLIDLAGAHARAGGAATYADVAKQLTEKNGFHLAGTVDLRPVTSRLNNATSDALEEIKDQVGGVRLSRSNLTEQAYNALETYRVVQIVGSPGVGKSAVMKHLVERVGTEGSTIVLRRGRIIRGGWLQMANALQCTATRERLFNELGCTGSATLFIDNVDQIENADEWSTVSDLLNGVARSPGWNVVVTAGIGNEDWKSRLPAAIKSSGIATIEVEPLSGAEAAILSEENAALGALLESGHPAERIARNLFYLSRMVELSAGQAQVSALTSEIELARLWWRFGGGQAEDSGRLARLRILRELARRTIADPSRTAFNVDVFEPSTASDLLQFDSLREETKGSTIAFRHDVLRDWAVGFLLHEEPSILSGMSKDQPLSAALARGVEIAARLALESDQTGALWLELLASAEVANAHGSWKRPVLLALPRSEQAITLLMRLEAILVKDRGRILSEIIKLMLAIDSEPIAKFIARTQPAMTVPAGAGDIVV
jgi:hypothetical protein